MYKLVVTFDFNIEESHMFYDIEDAEESLEYVKKLHNCTHAEILTDDKSQHKYTIVTTEYLHYPAKLY